MLKKLYLSVVNSDGESEKLLKLMKKYAQRGSRILDVGCGYGRNLDLLLNAGYGNATGVEINAEIVERNKSCGRACVTVDEFNRTADKFDIILMSHVVEHFAPADLKNFIDGYLDRLVPRGYLVVATPLMSDYFYDDFDHIKPYHPSGILMVFGGGGAQVQYYSRNKLKLVDLWFRKSHYHMSFFRSNYVMTPATRLIQFATFISAFAFLLSNRLLGKKDGWVGMFQKVGSQ